MSKTEKQLNHITKKSIKIGDQLGNRFHEHGETSDANAAIKAYRAAISAIAVKKYKS